MALARALRSKVEYETPSIPDLQHLLLTNFYPTGPVNEVWPNIYIGNAATARDKSTLFNMRITHIVNAAHGPHHINTGARFYRDMTIDYYGVEADDAEDFDLSPFFYPTAKFIRAALAQRGKVFVHCAMGVSRSATLVFAYLMLCENLTLVDAIMAVRQHRDVCPNQGFLNQLRRLDKTLVWERKRKGETYTVGAQDETQSESASPTAYETPPITELRRLLWTNRQHTGPFNQVWPGIYISDEDIARDKAILSDLGITHIVNAADGPRQINTGTQYYADMTIEYRGVQAIDHPCFDLSPSFYPIAEFIREALSQKGKVLVHCAMGVSRSAALVLAFLMICENLTLVDAINAVRKHRHVSPNQGFLEQLRDLDSALAEERRGKQDSYNPQRTETSDSNII